MREIKSREITEAVANLCIEANYIIGDDILKAIDEGLRVEESETGRDILNQLKENARLAREKEMPYCQDTGFAVFFVEKGRELSIDGSIYDAINEGVRKGYGEGYLRKSILRDPLRRVNTGDNTPAIIHLFETEGEKLHIIYGAKGGGSENMSKIGMLKPSDGEEGVKRFVVETVSIGGANACPPLVVGVGIGGTFEMSALLAKKAALRRWDNPNKDPYYAEMERELKDRCNKLGIGPMGLGGRVTVFGVNIEAHPCHIASLPVAVNINCHADRHGEIAL